MDLEHLPPHDIEAEEAVIGSLLVDGNALPLIEETLRPEDFYSESLGWCYAAILTIAERDESIDSVTVAHELERRGHLEEFGGSGQLLRLVAGVPTSLHIEHYAGIVANTALHRRLISGGGQIAAIGFRNGPDPHESLDEAEALLMALRGERDDPAVEHIRDIISTLFDEQTREGEGLKPIPTGFVDLDRLLGSGLHRGDLLVLAARTGVGKTSLALNIARNAALPPSGRGAHVGIFSLEMTRRQVVQRLLSAESSVPTRRLFLDAFGEDGARVQESMGRLSSTNIWVQDAALLRIAALRSRARRLHARHGLDLVIVDYLQLLRGSRPPYPARVEEVTEITRELKALALDLDVAVLACAQLNREVDGRQPPIPRLSDLRESGSIEQDADVVMFIYRDDVYYTREQWERRFPTKTYPNGLAKLILAKQRNGPTGEVGLYFFDELSKFGSLGGPDR